MCVCVCVCVCVGGGGVKSAHNCEERNFDQAKRSQGGKNSLEKSKQSNKNVALKTTSTFISNAANFV